jgi:hypothetical protein
MAKSPGGANRQAELFARSKRPTIPIEENHRLVLMTDAVDWTELLDLVEHIRLSKVKNGAGRPPHLRAMVGALLLKATRDMTLREAEDLMRHYAPARYLCGLTETEWTPDFRTLNDFEILLGEDGVRIINEYAVKQAVAEKLADPRVVVGDTTAQEAAVPYPNEMRLMAAFMTSLTAASRGVGAALKEFTKRSATEFKAAAQTVRKYRLFAKTKEARLKVMAEMIKIIADTQRKLGAALAGGSSLANRLKKHAKVAFRKVVSLRETMTALLPQITYWHRTGFVAKNKVISIHMRELYSIVRGKVGKDIEFGLNWGITRLRGGFLLASLATSSRELIDARFVLRSVDDCIGLFGKAPRAYAYDRAGHSAANVAALRAKGVKEVGLAPRGSTEWSVSKKVREKLVKERALVEAGIGTIKSRRYGFNRPRARSARMMGYHGQRAILGFNMNKLVRELAKREKVAIAGH